MGVKSSSRLHSNESIFALRREYLSIGQYIGQRLIPDFDLDKFNSKYRGGNYSVLRFLLYWYLNTNREIGLTDIGRIVNKDHTTILHGVNDFKTKLEINDPLSLYCRSLLVTFLKKNSKFRIMQLPYAVDYHSYENQYIPFEAPINKYSNIL